jgi:methylated-DNA-[protein]-cysteine S-methyltransferase
MRSVLPTPVATVEVVEEGGRLESLEFRERMPPTGPLGPVAKQIAAYLAGEGPDLSRIPINLNGFTEFERQVLEATRAIPHGETRTYGEIAAAVGKPGAARAVGNVLNANSAAIVVPCHRVVAANGPGGFGAGLPVKGYLLGLEGILL